MSDLVCAAICASPAVHKAAFSAVAVRAGSLLKAGVAILARRIKVAPLGGL
jgi:hypothetical protein